MRRDPTDGHGPAWQPLLQLPLRACLLSGGESRRMGRDKALLPHPEGGTWLERSLRLLAQLKTPITLLSRHGAHLEQAEELALELAPGSPITALAEPPPWEGPLLALHRLMEHHPDERLLLCPVDMPDLSLAALIQLTSSERSEPGCIQLAHDSERLQPLLGIYPSHRAIARSLATQTARGERRLQSWLSSQTSIAMRLDAGALRNVNHPGELPWHPAQQSRTHALTQTINAPSSCPPASSNGA